MKEQHVQRPGARERPVRSETPSDSLRRSRGRKRPQVVGGPCRGAGLCPGNGGPLEGAGKARVRRAAPACPAEGTAVCSRPKARGLGGRSQRHQRDLRSRAKRTEPEAGTGLWSGGRWRRGHGVGVRRQTPTQMPDARLRGCPCSGVSPLGTEAGSAWGGGNVGAAWGQGSLGISA